ncbi:MAG: hypothetical protein QOE64_1669 [Frankiales bacterium]|jgi:hypothetical protein|nr:hypothetical protein [Frankiales bacterium]
MRRLAVAIAVLPLVALASAAGASAPKVTTVFTDPAGDAGLTPNGSPTPIAPVNQLGVDVVKGTMSRQGNNLKYSVTLATAFPNYGELPELSRLIWQFTVAKGAEYRFTIKSFDIGKPDPVQQDGTDRIGKVYDKGEFRLERCGDPKTSPAPITFSQCTVIAQLTGAVDVTGKTLTWTLPLALIKAKTGTQILNGTGGLNDTGCNICFISHYAERSLSPNTVFDDAIPTATKYTVPKG